MDPNEFLAGYSDVSSAKHGQKTVYIGRDPEMQWWMLWNGTVDCVAANTSEEAEAAAHLNIDGDAACGEQLEWLQVSGTRDDDVALPV